MEQVFENLYVGNERDCVQASGMAVVHACKHPCHVNEGGYSGSLPQDHWFTEVDLRGLLDRSSNGPSVLEPVLDFLLDLFWNSHRCVFSLRL